MKYNKLVRDGIPDLIRENGEIPLTKKLGSKAFKEELKKKLIEESKELQKAKTREELIEELADIQEVLLSLYEAEKVACGDINKVRNKKRKKRGAFNTRIYLKGVKK